MDELPIQVYEISSTSSLGESDDEMDESFNVITASEDSMDSDEAYVNYYERLAALSDPDYNPYDEWLINL